MKAVRIKGIIKDYSWGNDYFISELLGIEKKGVMAEYWIGSHPSGDALLDDGSSLGAYISSDLEGALGKKNALSYSSLPLLLKILAVRRPLSIQCHPDKAQAEEGWIREEGLRREGLLGSYQDDNKKAELLYATTPLSALCGFMELSRVIDNLRTYIPSFFNEHLKGESGSIRQLVFYLYSLSAEDKRVLIEELVSNISKSPMPLEDGPFLTLKGIVLAAHEDYPDDIGLVFPLLMNIVHLQDGEALYLKPDTMHAYVRGNAVELMDASDNVIRGGLTKKRCDIKELRRIMDSSPTKIEKIVPMEMENGISAIDTPSDTFLLRRIVSGCHVHNKSAGIILVLDGKLKIEGECELCLKKGESAFIPYSSNSKLIVSGTVFEALVR